MYVFGNLGMCHNTEGIAPEFAGSVGRDSRHVSASGVGHGKNALELSAPEILMIALIAKQLLEAKG